jgi:C-terminal processing protease CtpA/Prc
MVSVKRLIGLPLALLLSLLVISAPAASQDETATIPPAQVINDQGGTQFITGTAHYTFPYFRLFLPNPFIVLYDSAGLVERDVNFFPMPESQSFGMITSDPYEPPFTYDLPLPIIPRGQLRDVDNNGQSDTGVMIFTIVAASNFWANPFLEERDTFTSGVISSLRVSTEIDTFLHVEGGTMLIYAPEEGQGFPNGFGDDGILFTEDDPIVEVPVGYTVVNLNQEPFTFNRAISPKVPLIESENAELDDFSDLGYLDAFDAMIELLSNEYAFTEYKGVDWAALADEFRPLMEQADDNRDFALYQRVLRDLAWRIPDGHVSGPFVSGDFQTNVAGGLGMVIRETDDDRVLVTYLKADSPADRAGVKLGAEILSLNNHPIQDVLDSTVPYSSPFSTPHNLRLQQLIYAIRFPIDRVVRMSFRNPGDDVRDETMVTVFDPDTFGTANDIDNAPARRGDELPVEFRVLDSGLGHLSIYSFSDDLQLTVALWERAIEQAVSRRLPGLIIDIRQNGGGSGFLGDQLPAYFFDEEHVLGNSARYSRNRNEFVVIPELEDRFILPTHGVVYRGPIAVLISPNCASACESFAYAMTVADRAAVIGQYPTAGLGGSVVPIAMPDDQRFSYTNTRSLDADGNIHIEGIGVQPTIVVPVNEETLFAEGDFLLAAAEEYLTSLPNDYRVLNAGILTLGESIVREIERGQRIRFQVNVRQGDIISVTADTVEPSGMQTIIRLYLPDQADPVADNFTNAQLFQNLEIPQDLTLIFEIATSYDTGAGTFEFKITDNAGN